MLNAAMRLNISIFENNFCIIRSSSYICDTEAIYTNLSMLQICSELTVTYFIVVLKINVLKHVKF